MRPLLPLLLWPQALAEVRTCNPSAPGGRGACLTSITGCSFLTMLSYRVVPEGIGLMMCFLSFAARSRKSKLSPPWHFQTVVCKTFAKRWNYIQCLKIHKTKRSRHANPRYCSKSSRIEPFSTMQACHNVQYTKSLNGGQAFILVGRLAWGCSWLVDYN
jgi:hypothetical protein